MQRNDNSLYSVHGIRERNDTSGVRTMESVNGERNNTILLSDRLFGPRIRGHNTSGVRVTESVHRTPALLFTLGFKTADIRKRVYSQSKCTDSNESIRWYLLTIYIQIGNKACTNRFKKVSKICFCSTALDRKHVSWRRAHVIILS
jgi:hypothetical protein